MKQMTCPYCHRRVIFDDAGKSVAHEMPECADFAALVAQRGGHHPTLVMESGLPAHFASVARGAPRPEPS